MSPQKVIKGFSSFYHVCRRNGFINICTGFHNLPDVIGHWPDRLTIVFSCCDSVG